MSDDRAKYNLPSDESVINICSSIHDQNRFSKTTHTDFLRRNKLAVTDYTEPYQTTSGNDQLEACIREVKEHYVNNTNVLKIALPPTSREPIYAVEDLHVPAIQKECEISPDLPVMTEIPPRDIFQKHPARKRRTRYFGAPGVGKTTEIKMWLYEWCKTERGGPLRDFALVFYIDAAKLECDISLGEAIANQCLPNTRLSLSDIENMCHNHQDDILVILDNYNKWKKRIRHSGTKIGNSLMSMVSLKSFQGLTVLVATSVVVGDLGEIYANYDHVKVEGVSDRSVFTYVRKVFKDRQDFASKVEEYLKVSNLVQEMASSPVLLCILCQIVKWHPSPMELGEIKTAAALMDKVIQCLIDHGGDFGHEMDVYPRQQGASAGAEAYKPGVRDETVKGASYHDETTFRDIESGLRQMPVTGRERSISKETMIDGLAAVAHRRFFDKKNQDDFKLSLSDFDVCGDMKIPILQEAMRCRLVVRSDEDRYNPSCFTAAEGKVYRMIMPQIQHRLAAIHLAKLRNKDQASFLESLQKIESIDDVISLQKLMVYLCGDSIDAAECVIGHVVDLTRKYAESRVPTVQKDAVLREPDGQYQYLAELIFELNHESGSAGKFNDIIGPILSNLQIMSPSVLVTRSLLYLLTHADPQNAPSLHDVHIDVLNVQPEITTNLPTNDHLRYQFIERSQVKIKESTLNCGQLRITREPQGGRPDDINVETPTEQQLQHQQTMIRNVKEQILNVVPDYYGKDPSINIPQLPSQQIVAGATGGPEQTSSRGRPKRVIENLDDPSSYIVNRFIAYGGYAEVHEATWKEEKVALKRIRLVEERMIETLKREININARVSHPNIVVLYAYSMYQPGTTTNYCADLLMEFIDGFTLSDAVFENKVEYLITTQGQLITAKKLSDAIAHIHDMGFTHSDIKPDNVLIRKADNEPFVCDLGLGHGVTRSALSKYTPGFRRGVPKWYPPESFGKRGKNKRDKGYKISYEGDVWSLACTLLEVFTRKRVWEDIEDDIDLAERLEEEDVTPEIISAVENEAVREALRRCFNKIPEERPPAKELTAIFQQALLDDAMVDLAASRSSNF